MATTIKSKSRIVGSFESSDIEALWRRNPSEFVQSLFDMLEVFGIHIVRDVVNDQWLVAIEEPNEKVF